MTDQWMDRLSEYLDGDLTDTERRALEAHLTGCTSCRTTVDELRRVVTHAHALVDRPVTTDLWAGVAGRIGASGAGVVDLEARRARRRVTFSIPQLAAAAVFLLAAGSGAATLVLRAPAPPAPIVGSVEPPGFRALPAGLPDKAELSYDTAVRDLERILEAGRGRLSPKTVSVLARNLSRIDLAIEEARTALAADPANAYLSAHLANAMQQKLALLQQATILAAPAS